MTGAFIAWKADHDITYSYGDRILLKTTNEMLNASSPFRKHLQDGLKKEWQLKEILDASMALFTEHRIPVGKYDEL